MVEQTFVHGQDTNL